VARRKGGATGSGGPEDYRVEDQVGHLLRRAHQRASAIFQAHIGAPDLTPTQFAALVKLRDEGSTSQNQLGRLTAMDRATILGVIRRLDARGLIARTADRRDRRRTLLSLTPRGRQLIARLAPNGFTVSARILAPLTEAERRTFLALLRRLG
jgi:DNA-binding MarR family transcriptional regulator